MVFIWQLSILTLSSKTIINGVVLKAKYPGNKKRKRIFKNLINLLNSYAKTTLKNSELTIQLNNNEFRTTTNSHGAFNIELDFTLEEKPEISILHQDENLKIIQDYPVFFRNTDANLNVISDIDDTILISHTANIIKRIGVMSLITPEKRRTIEFTQKLLTLLNRSSCNVFYISKSESNLFRILHTFIIINQLPKGILLLTPYLNFKQLLKGKKENDFKLKNIQFILENSTDKKFILLGDDTQKDMEVYTKIVKMYPSKIARIYIRQTNKNTNDRKRLLWENLKKTFSDSVYFNKNTDIDIESKHIENLILKNKL
jgi:phosphatidate phosphatase APP1